MTPEFPDDPGACPAHGCPLRGSIDLGGAGRFVCSAHAGQPHGRWQAITAALNEHRWLIDHMADIGRTDMHQRWRALAATFWANSEPELMQPKAFETRELYLYRLHLELLHRVGARTQRPDPMVPQGGMPKARTAEPLQRRRPDLLSVGQSMLAPEADPDERLAAAKARADQQVKAYQGEVA